MVYMWPIHLRADLCEPIVPSSSVRLPLEFEPLKITLSSLSHMFYFETRRGYRINHVSILDLFVFF